MSLDDSVITQWATIEPYIDEMPNWVAEEDRLRLGAYTTYENIYWNVEDAIELIRRQEDGPALLIPKPMTIVDTTSYYLLKGLSIDPVDPEKDGDLTLWLKNFFKREKFYSRFHGAKHSGVRKGDWLFHITADPEALPERRVSLTTLDPAVYFPEYDPDDMETIIAVRLVEQWQHPDDPLKLVVKVLKYWYEDTGVIWREEDLWELEDWYNAKRAVKVKSLIPASPLDARITTIPVYHFRNREDDGHPWGNSELRGFERIFQAIDQAISDEEIALALVGLGVYATDAGRPIDPVTKQPMDWVVSPGFVWEMPGATMVKKLEGISSVTPVQDHVGYIEGTLHEASGTSDVAIGRIDAQTAESGVALAIKFIPTLAKVEQRDTAGIEILQQMFFDLMFWFLVYEGKNWIEKELNVVIGDKLPVNRVKVLEELNNMLDRKVISAQFYREEATRKLGFTFPADIDQQILDELAAKAEAAMEIMQTQQRAEGLAPPGAKGAGDTLPDSVRSRSNNKERVNESNGTEAR